MEPEGDLRKLNWWSQRYTSMTKAYHDILTIFSDTMTEAASLHRFARLKVTFLLSFLQIQPHNKQNLIECWRHDLLSCKCLEYCTKKVKTNRLLMG